MQHKQVARKALVGSSQKSSLIELSQGQKNGGGGVSNRFPTIYSITVESRDYAPPPLYMLGLGKSGEGAYTRDPNISV